MPLVLTLVCLSFAAARIAIEWHDGDKTPVLHSLMAVIETSVACMIMAVIETRVARSDHGSYRDTCCMHDHDSDRNTCCTLRSR